MSELSETEASCQDLVPLLQRAVNLIQLLVNSQVNFNAVRDGEEFLRVLAEADIKPDNVASSQHPDVTPSSGCVLCDLDIPTFTRVFHEMPEMPQLCTRTGSGGRI